MGLATSCVQREGVGEVALWRGVCVDCHRKNVDSGKKKGGVLGVFCCILEEEGKRKVYKMNLSLSLLSHLINKTTARADIISLWRFTVVT